MIDIAKARIRFIIYATYGVGILTNRTALINKKP
jgi:hypothetical protein